MTIGQLSAVAAQEARLPLLLSQGTLLHCYALQQGADVEREAAASDNALHSANSCQHLVFNAIG